MTKPDIAQKGPYAVDVEPGDYFWCACGKSKKQPFCDGSHKGSGFSPVKVTVDKAKTLFLCGCKHTANPPFCDGSHGSL
ncbi:MAG: CDGSH iron-sulfur domain-containing protein [Gammaproteobacteria bacterium]|nr:CDGSH iron-sulfur domain-containing protein [Gammaproteobacteria bacterium]